MTLFIDHLRRGGGGGFRISGKGVQIYKGGDSLCRFYLISLQCLMKMK